MSGKKKGLYAKCCLINSSLEIIHIDYYQVALQHIMDLFNYGYRCYVYICDIFILKLKKKVLPCTLSLFVLGSGFGLCILIAVSIAKNI